MKMKKYLQLHRIRQIELANKINAPMSVVNVYLNGWKPLPEKHIGRFARFVGVSESEVRAGKVCSREAK